MTTGLGASLRRGVGGAPAKGPWSPALVTFHLDLCLGPSVHLFPEGYFLLLYFMNQTLSAKPCQTWLG